MLHQSASTVHKRFHQRYEECNYVVPLYTISYAIILTLSTSPETSINRITGTVLPMYRECALYRIKSQLTLPFYLGAVIHSKNEA